MAYHSLPYLTKSCHLSWKEWELRFGSRFMDGTDGQFGVLEMILSTSISGVLFSTFAGQPLSILGATGPFLAYTLVVFDLAEAMDIEFMPFYWWTCMWCAVFTVLVAMFDLCALMKHVTMFSEDIFAGLISLIFIIDGVRPIIQNFTDGEMKLTNCFLEHFCFCTLCDGHLPLPHAPNTMDDATSSQPPGQFFSHNCLGLCICPGSYLGQWCVFEDAGSWHQPFSDLAVGIWWKATMDCEPQRYWARVPCMGDCLCHGSCYRLCSVWDTWTRTWPAWLWTGHPMVCRKVQAIIWTCLFVVQSLCQLAQFWACLCQWLPLCRASPMWSPWQLMRWSSFPRVSVRFLWKWWSSAQQTSWFTFWLDWRCFWLLSWSSCPARSCKASFSTWALLPDRQQSGGPHLSVVHLEPRIIRSTSTFRSCQWSVCTCTPSCRWFAWPSCTDWRRSRRHP